MWRPRRLFLFLFLASPRKSLWYTRCVGRFVFCTTVVCIYPRLFFFLFRVHYCICGNSKYLKCIFVGETCFSSWYSSTCDDLCSLSFSTHRTFLFFFFFYCFARVCSSRLAAAAAAAIPMANTTKHHHHHHPNDLSSFACCVGRWV